MNSSFRPIGYVAAGIVLAMSAALAQTPLSSATYKKHMDDIQEAKDDLAYAIDDKKASEATDAANRLATLLRTDIDYWQAKKLDNALELARQSHQLATQAAQQVQNNNLAEAQTTVVQLQIKCRTCHDSHPERQ